MTLDPIDGRLLNLLQEDSSRSLLDLGKHVGLSISGVKERLRKLRARGDVRAYVALINPRSVGYTTCAFVQVVVEGAKNERAFIAFVLRMHEVEECHRISGEYAFLLKIWAQDIPHLDRLLSEKIKSRAGVVRTQMSIVLSSPKDQVTGLTAK